MKGYLGEFPVAQEVTPFARFKSTDWALYFIESYGGVDGSHHKQWLIDQLARILNGANIAIVEARWEGGHTEYRVRVGTCDKYITWVKDQKAGEDGPETYGWEEGIAP